MTLIENEKNEKAENLMLKMPSNHVYINTQAKFPSRKIDKAFPPVISFCTKGKTTSTAQQSSGKQNVSKQVIGFFPTWKWCFFFAVSQTVGIKDDLKWTRDYYNLDLMDFQVQAHNEC
jgi:hypothetical protein